VQRRNYDEITRFVRQLVENIQREDLNDVDRAYGMVRLRDMMQAELDARLAEGEGSGKPHSRTVSWAKVSRRLGFSRQRASQLIQLLDLPEEIKDAVRAGEISERDTRALQGLKASQQRALYRALEAGDVTTQEYKQVARFLKKEQPEMRVYEAIDVLHKPLPPAGTGETAVPEEEAAEETAVSPPDAPLPPDETTETDSIPVTNLKRLAYIRNHLAHIDRSSLTPDERREMIRLLRLIEQDVASLLTALE
jgi:ParB family chromosome partitioning protein